jgi:hypothetical protein
LKLSENRAFRFLLTVLLPLAAGVLIYLFCSPSTRYFFQFFPEPSVHFPLWNWVSFSLPDGLWTFSFVSFALIIFHEKNLARNVFICVALLAGPFLELLQLFHFIPGTFDVTDVLLQFVAGAAALFCGRSFSTEKNFHLRKFKTALTLAGCFVFLIMAFANSPEEPQEDDPQERAESQRSIMLINSTGKPVHVIEEGIIPLSLDSGTGNFKVNPSPAGSNYYFIFAFYRGLPYPGIMKDGIKTAPQTQIDEWTKSGKLKSFSYSMDQALLLPEDQRITFKTDTDGIVSQVSFWLLPGYDPSFRTTIPDNNPENILTNDSYSSFKIFFTNKNGQPDSLRLRGREFYKHIDKRGVFEIR